VARERTKVVAIVATRAACTYCDMASTAVVHSREAVAMAWTVAMVASKSVAAISETVEAMATILRSKTGGAAMMKVWSGGSGPGSEPGLDLDQSRIGSAKCSGAGVELGRSGAAGLESNWVVWCSWVSLV
jgi:TRAP-type mannitol/chloroaromatic compound transport system substrate-binding protein